MVRTELLFIENNMADVAAGQFALERLWVRFHSLCRTSALDIDILDAIWQELRLIESGLAASRRGLQRQRTG